MNVHALRRLALAGLAAVALATAVPTAALADTDPPALSYASWSLEKAPWVWSQDPYFDEGRTPGFGLKPTGDVSLVPDTRVIGASTVALHGAGAVATTAPVFRTDQPYYVSTWAKLDGLGANGTVASQDGGQVSAFRIEYVARLGQWCIAARLADEAGADSLHTCATTPATTEWTHLAGGYDGTGLVLYVDGVLAASRAIPAPTWNATGPLVLGRALCHGEACRGFSGSLADARARNRAIDPAELRSLHPLMTPRRAAYWSIDTSCCGQIDDYMFGHHLTLAPDAVLEDLGSGYGLRGTAAHAGPVLRTDGGFTVTAGVFRFERADGTLLSIDGVNQSLLRVGYDAASATWCATVALADDPAAATVAACAADPAAELPGAVMVTAAYDSAADTLTLYVNGTALATVAVPSPLWHATGTFTLGGIDGLVFDPSAFTGRLTDEQLDEILR